MDRTKLANEYQGERVGLLVNILQNVPASQFKSEVERIREEPTDYSHMDEFDRYLVQAIFVKYGQQKNREMLIYLLSAKCPRFVAASPVELEIATMEISQPLLILFDSYDAATNGERTFLLNILRDSFHDLSKKHQNDAEFVKTSKIWYLDNESKLTPNPYYHPVGSASQRDLFLTKQ